MAQESWKREEEASCQLPEGPVLCTNNCGFFGSVTTMNLCSKCYRDQISKQSKSATTISLVNPVSHVDVVVPPEVTLPPPPPPVVQPDVPVDKAKVTIITTTTTVVESEPVTNGTSEIGSPTSTSDQPRLPNRCFACRKRVGLTGFKCRCGDVFCSLHRYSDKHNCTYDYKAAAREAIAKANPVVKADKIEKI